MKKTALLIFAAVLMTLPFVNFSYAEEMMGPGGGEEQGGRKDKMMNMMGMGMMNRPSVIATSDGGVVVLAGPKLTKYDKDLNLVNEVELKRPEPKKDSKLEAFEPPPAPKRAEAPLNEQTIVQ